MGTLKRKRLRTTRLLWLSALALGLVFGGTELALAANWGPKTSSYDGVVRVQGSGTLTRQAGGSYSSVTAKDRANDGNKVYGYTRWNKITQRCSEFGVSYVIVGTTSSCSVSTSTFGSLTTPEIGGLNQIVTRSKTQSWCDQNGSNCADYGLKVVTGACAQMGFPIPNNCTYAYVEYHRP